MNKQSFSSNKWLIILIVSVLLIRLLPINFPFFTFEEARIAFRGYTLATSGTDELGRAFPLLFNSLEDYQLPVVSYLTALGELVFGKTDFGVRIPFILIGTLLVFLTYKLAKHINPRPYFWFLSAFIVGFSPPLIFLSQVPNEAIVLTFILTLLFYLLISNKSLLATLLIIVAAVLTSKFSWFILLPFLILILYGKGVLTRKKSFRLIIITGAIIILAFSLFLIIPQGKRSLMENNFSIFSDLTIKNGIDQLRGQSLKSEWPNFIARVLFNKAHYLLVGFIHWLSHLSPASLFGTFDPSGKMNFFSLGVFTKILIIPAILGLIFLIKNGEKKRFLILLPLIITLPAIFIYPNNSLVLVILAIPFIALIVASGLIQFKRKIILLIIFLVCFELLINIFNQPQQNKNSNMMRPSWVQSVVLDISESSKQQTVVSDNIVSDIVPFILWYTTTGIDNQYSSITFPYKFLQYNLTNTKIINSDGKFTSCGKNEQVNLFVSKRDLDKIKQVFDVSLAGFYKDNIGMEKVANITSNICI